MTVTEYLVVVLGLFVGYWMVNNFLSDNKKTKNEQDTNKPRGQDIDHEFSKMHSKNWYVTLGTSPSASVDEIRKAYKSQMSKYHPDKVATLGTELKELAEKKTKEINIAYKRAMKDHNISEQLW